MRSFQRIFALVCLIFIMSSCANRQVGSLEQLEGLLRSVMSETEGDFALVFQDLNNRDNSLYLNADETFHAASTMKTPVMIEVFKQAEAGKFSVYDSIEVKNEFSSIVDGSPFSLNIDRDWGDGLYGFLGKKKSILTVTYDMITVSGNLATNNIIELVGADNANASMHELGATNIKVLRGVEDMKAFDLGMSNETTARDLAIIFESLAGCTFISQEACEMMIDILADQEFTNIIPALLPDDVRVAHKTGSITGVSHDSGIVYLPDGRSYVLVVLSKNLNDASEGAEAGARMSRIIYDFLNP